MLITLPNMPSSAAASTTWFDLCSPTDAEISEVENATGTKLPRRDALSEVERSSRLQRKGDVLTMSTPTTTRGGLGSAVVAPLGFVLSNDWLITIRFTQLPAFDAVHGRLDGANDVVGGLEVFTQLCEEIVDRVADGLEHIAEDLGILSNNAFLEDDDNATQAVKSNRVLRTQLRQVGRLGDRLSEIRDGLLGLGRVLAYAEQHGCRASEQAIKVRLADVRQDLSSMADYDEHLAGKVQFVLDALVGLIGIAQNDVFKVLTIVSIVGIAPTLLAGIYGMNFKNMPEYNWTYGYEYGLAVIFLSGLIPLIWFKAKGWF